MNTDLSQLPEPYASARLMPFNPHGWHNNPEELEKLIQDTQAMTIVEVGSWMGASARHMASLLPAGGKIYSVDTWEGSPNEEYDPAVLATLYDQFLSNIIHSGLTDKIIPYRMDSLKAAASLDVTADLIYIDATHDYPETLHDIRAWYPRLKKGGILCGDDLRWGSRGVELSVRHFAVENDLTYATNGWFWHIVKK